MKPAGTQPIFTERLLLRRFIIDDAQDMFDHWASDCEVAKYLRWAPHNTVEETKELLREWVKCYDGITNYNWGIVLRESNTLIGGISFVNIHEADECGEVGYCLGKPWWGKGLMTEALQGVLRFAFDQCGFHRIEAYHSVRNPASGRVMQKAGMIFEGISREKYKANAGFQDCKSYAVLKADYIGHT